MNDDTINKIVSELKNIHIQNLRHSGSGSVNIIVNINIVDSVNKSNIDITNNCSE